MIKIIDIAWAAGIYEGEGNFTGHSVTVGQKNKWLCDKLQLLFGGNVTHQESRHAEYFVWHLSGKKCRGFLLTIFTFLSPRRRKQIKEFPKFFIDPFFKRQEFCRNGHEYTRENTLIVEDDRNPEGWIKRCKVCYKERNRRAWEKSERIWQERLKELGRIN